MDIDEVNMPESGISGRAEGQPMIFKLKLLNGQEREADISQQQAMAAPSVLMPVVPAIPAQTSPLPSLPSQQAPLASTSAVVQNPAVGQLQANTAAVEPPAKKRRGPAKKKKEEKALPDGEVKPHWRRGLKGKAADAANFYNTTLKPDDPPKRTRTRKPKADPANPSQAGTPEPGAIPGTSSFSVAAPKALTGTLAVVPLAAKTPKVRQWIRVPFQFVNVAGNVVQMKTWTGSEQSAFMEYKIANAPPPPPEKDDDEDDTSFVPAPLKPAKKRPSTVVTSMLPSAEVVMPPPVSGPSPQLSPAHQFQQQHMQQMPYISPTPRQHANLSPMDPSGYQHPYPTLPAARQLSPSMTQHAFSSPQSHVGYTLPPPPNVVQYTPSPHMSGSPMSLNNLMSPQHHNTPPIPFFNTAPPVAAQHFPHSGNLQHPFPPMPSQPPPGERIYEGSQR